MRGVKMMMMVMMMSLSMHCDKLIWCFWCCGFLLCTCFNVEQRSIWRVMCVNILHCVLIKLQHLFTQLLTFGDNCCLPWN